MGESTRAQAEAARDAAAREHAPCGGCGFGSEDDAVMGSPPVRGVLDAASQLTFADLSEDSDDE